jgi:hypothetical protein
MNPSYFLKSQNYFKLISESYFLKKIKYGIYSIFYVQNKVDGLGDVVNIYVVKKIDNNYFLTNDLKDDYMYLYIMKKIKEELPLNVDGLGAR